MVSNTSSYNSPYIPRLIMPKLKTRKAAIKRYHKISANCYMRHHAFTGHLLMNRSKKQKRNLSVKASVSKADISSLKLMLPY